MDYFHIKIDRIFFFKKQNRYPMTLGTIINKGYTCVIEEDATGRVYFTADADIDVDGANGQHGAPAAYRVDDKGSEYLANGGMELNKHNKVVCKHDWARSIVILDTDNEPKVFPGGIIASKTWYKHPGKAANDPAAYVDAATIPYIVVPPLIVKKTKGVVRGCKARVTYKGISIDAVVADCGPADKIGELSIAAAEQLKFKRTSPRDGGVDGPEVLYELWPGIAVPGFTLQPA